MLILIANYMNGDIKFVIIFFLGKELLLSLAGIWVSLKVALQFVVEENFQCPSCTTQLNTIVTTVNILIVQKQED